MKPEHIELFVDRLCGLFPKDNIARNTVKNAWRHDNMLLNCSNDDARAALTKLESDPGFPSLARVKDVLRGLSTKLTRNDCNICHGSGWDDGMRMGIGADGEPYVRREPYSYEWEGRSYRCSKRCTCMEARKDDEANVGLPALF